MYFSWQVMGGGGRRRVDEVVREMFSIQDSYDKIRVGEAK